MRDSRPSCDDRLPGTAAAPGWWMTPVAVLRQAGYPMELLDPLVDHDIADAATGLLDLESDVARLARPLCEHLARSRVAGRHAARRRVRGLRRLSRGDLLLFERAGPEALSAAHAYEQAVGRLALRRTAFRRRFDDRMRAARHAVVETFADESLREVLLLSNGAHYQTFTRRLDAFPDELRHHERRLTDTLTLYLQRVTTKNESYAHFGPLSVGRVDAQPAVRWRKGPLERRTSFAYWAAEELAAAMASRTELRLRLRPHRHPWASLVENRIRVLIDPRDHGRAVSEPAAWLWAQCDGSRTVAELREAWAERYGADTGADTGSAAEPYESTLAQLVDSGFLLTGFEIPYGDPHPLRLLLRRLDEWPADRGHKAQRTEIASLEADCARFADEPPGGRPRLLSDIKNRFEALTGVPADRAPGQFYADRTVLREYAHGEVRDLRIGCDLADFITGELSMAYEIGLAGPRARMRLETDLFVDWLTGRFGAEVPVPLKSMYAAFRQDSTGLSAACAAVDSRVAQLESWIHEQLMEGSEPGCREVVIGRERMSSVLRCLPDGPAAVLNPDIQFAASGPEALNAGDFLAVIGDFHALRELLTKTTFASLIEEAAPEVTAQTYAGYLGLLEDDEILVDQSRDAKLVRLPFPCHDLDVVGRPGAHLTRGRVLHPDGLYVLVRDGRPELRSRTLPQRLRLTAPPISTYSLAHDPLALFSFPRRYGGPMMPLLRAHEPRMRCGRVVLRRESWLVSADRLREQWPGGGPAPAGQAAEYVTAQRIRRELGMPRHVFVVIPGEPKPIYVDWEAPLLVRQVFRLAQQAGGELRFSEMLPGPDHRWLVIDGRRYTSELRCALFSPAPGVSGEAR